jgi:acetyl esterase/lipase
MKSILLILFSISSLFLFSQDKYSLWEEGKMPYHLENNIKEYEKEVWGTTCVCDVTKPELTVFPAKGDSTGLAVIICPGGGYSVEAIYHEGYDVAKVLSDNGITAAVLKYRLPLKEASEQPHLLPITDVQRALEMMREMSKQYGFEKDKVGVMGFSAGSHLSSLAASKEFQRPNFAMLIYGCPLLSNDNITWLEESLFHRKMTAEELEEYDLLARINGMNPPTFLVHSLDDETCHYTETTLCAKALRDHAIPNEVHLFPTGGHGFGLGREVDGTDQWIGLAINWMKRLE